MKKNISIKSLFAIAGIAIMLLQSNLMSQSGWYPLESGTTNILRSIYFINPNTGFIAGNNIILKTGNGGFNWFILTQNFGGTAVHFINQYSGFVCDGTLYRTSDGGATWVDQEFSTLNSVYFYDTQIGCAVGKNSQILMTVNGGLTWDPQEVTPSYSTFNRAKFISSNVGFVVGGRMYFPYYGVIYKTTNGGVDWRLIDPSAQDIEFTGISFPTPTIGYLVGRYQYSSSGVIYKTTDAGDTWNQLGIFYKDLNDVCFSSVNIGYAVGEDGTILKTTNGSSLWTLQQSNTNLDIHSVFFLQDDLGFTAGNSGTAQKTINGGIPGPPFAVAGRVFIQGVGNATSGIVKAVKYNANSNSVQVVDSAFVDSLGNYIMRRIGNDTLDIMVFPDDEDSPVGPTYVPTYYTGTNNGTINWLSAAKLIVNNNVFNVNVYAFPISSQAGSRIISGGVYSGPPEPLNGLKDAVVYAQIGSSFVGYGVSRTGGVYDINNIPSGTYRVVCDRMGYRSATRDTVVAGFDIEQFNFYLTNINVIGITPITSEIPKQYKLEQNYPNPFNPVTNINIAIPVRSNVKLMVFDMLGREIETLVNGNLEAGSYKVSWNAQKYSSGIYFYRIIADGFTDTRKMILVK